MQARTAVPARPELNPGQAMELSKRLLQVDTRIGVLASVHLTKVNTITGENVGLARTVYKWIFDAHDVIMGDCNTEWARMIGAEDPTRSASSKAATKAVTSIREGAWVKSTSHACAQRPSYLPSARNDYQPIAPKPIDLIVVKRPLSVELHEKQPGPKLVTCKFPRGLMKSTRWPSDHVPVVGVVRKAGVEALVVATWNVADPHYFARFFDEGPDVGFDWQPEPQRLEAIAQQVDALLTTADVVGLQEVPAALVAKLAALGASRQFHVQWVAAPSEHDEVLYAGVVGRRGDSFASGGGDRDPSCDLESLPQVAHDMLLTRYSSLNEPPVVAADGTVEGTLAAALMAQPTMGSSQGVDVGAEGAAPLPHAAAGDLAETLGLVNLNGQGASELEIADSWEDL
jgi:endonuclease/exonuclease/phosphatase family metal-dependent hydrolase